MFSLNQVSGRLLDTDVLRVEEWVLNMAVKYLLYGIYATVCILAVLLFL